MAKLFQCEAHLIPRKKKETKETKRQDLIDARIRYTSQSARDQRFLLYLPTQMRFPIGGGRVKCRGSKLTNSLGWKKLTNSLGKQQLELSTRTWSGRAPCNGGKFVCESAWCQKAIEVGQLFSLEKAFIVEEKGFIIRQKHIRLAKFEHFVSSSF